MNTIKNFWNDETGLELSEYAIGTALVAATVVAAVTALGDSIIARIKETILKIDAIN